MCYTPNSITEVLTPIVKNNTPIECDRQYYSQPLFSWEIFQNE